jgi:hypothetical protein
MFFFGFNLNTEDQVNIDVVIPFTSDDSENSPPPLPSLLVFISLCVTGKKRQTHFSSSPEMAQVDRTLMV